MATILYIAGWGRSGTTLLDTLAGQIEGFASTGELHHVWQRGLLERRQCGCGLPLPECPVWQAVFDRGFGGIDEVDPRAALRAAEGIRTRHAARIRRLLRAGRVETDCAYASYLDKLYRGVADATGARVVVDSSKYPVDPIVAAGLSAHRVHVVHLVRDPRAVAFSWQRRKVVADKTADGGLLRRVGYLRSTLVWQVFNLVIARLVRSAVSPQRYLRVSYERLAAEPEAVLDEIRAFVGAGDTVGPRFEGRRVVLSTTHTAAGNPSRFRTGPVDITPDTEWAAAMPTRRRFAIAALASPTLRLMGYRFRTT